MIILLVQSDSIEFDKVRRNKSPISLSFYLFILQFLSFADFYKKYMKLIWSYYEKKGRSLNYRGM